MSNVTRMPVQSVHIIRRFDAHEEKLASEGDAEAFNDLLGGLIRSAQAAVEKPHVWELVQERRAALNRVFEAVRSSEEADG